MTLIDWYIVVKLSVPCSGQKSTSGKTSVDSIHNWPQQLTLRLSLLRLPQIVQVKRHLTQATSHDISKKLFSPLALFETTRSENRIDITQFATLLYGATKRCGQLNVKLLFNQV